MSRMMFAVASRAKDFILKAIKEMSDDDRRTLAMTLLDKKLGWIVAHNLDRFQGLGKQVARRLVEEDADHAGQVMRHLSAFGLSDDEKRELMYLAVDRGQGWAIRHAVRDLPLDSGFGKHLIINGHERIVGDHLSRFTGYTETQFREDRVTWQKSFDLRFAAGQRYGKRA